VERMWFTRDFECDRVDRGVVSDVLRLVRDNDDRSEATETLDSGELE